jgi:hypothetical protein
MIDCEGCGRKWSWPSLRYYICLKGIRGTTNISVTMVGVLAEILTRLLRKEPTSSELL